MNAKDEGPPTVQPGADVNSLISLTSSEIHLWLVFCDEIDGERLDAAYRPLLNSEEQEREKRFFFQRDRRRYLITRALVRTVLSRYVSIHPKEWIFATNPYGRPYIVNAEARDERLSFNVSHSCNLVVLGVTKGRALGVDVENFRAREMSLDIASRFFSPQEAAALASAPPHLRQYRFFEYWTFKESYIKARGMGLSLALDTFTFHYPGDAAVEIEIHPGQPDESGRWQFWQLRPSPDFLIAVCAEREAAGRSTILTIRKAIPMLVDRRFPAQVLRVSR